MNATLAAYQSENMRLTNELEEMRYLASEKAELEGLHTSSNAALSEQLHALTAEREALARRAEEAEGRVRHLTNELDDAKLNHTDAVATMRRAQAQMRADTEALSRDLLLGRRGQI